MTRHLLRLMWNRKRQNLLLSAEVFFSFVVLFVVLVLGLNYWNNWRQDLGYRYENLWRVQLILPPQEPEQAARSRTRIGEMLAALRSMPGVVQAGAINTPPFLNWDCGFAGTLPDGREVLHGCNAGDDALAGVMRFEMLEGRWFNREDDAAAVGPVVINEQMARDVFGTASPIGRLLPLEYRRPPNSPAPPQRRVVGVMRDFRLSEFETPRNYAFTRFQPAPIQSLSGPFASMLMVQAESAVTASFEETLLETLRPIATDWGFSIKPVSDDHTQMISTYQTGFAVVGMVVAFLVLMVALGLSGVVWQNVTERIREFGLRRAKGAAAADIRWQVMLEVIILTSIAIVPGVFLALQIPLLPLPQNDGFFPPPHIYMNGLVASVAVTYAIVLACGWYPSRMATKIHPAQALHYE